MLAYLEQLPPRTLPLVLASAFALTLLACYLYLFKQPLAQYRDLVSQHDRSAAELQAQRSSYDAAEIAALQSAIASAEDRLYGEGPRPGPRDLVPHVVDRLDGLSRDHAVSLRSVKPGKVEQVLMFDEVPFDIAVQGRYFDLYDWLLDVESALRPMVVKHFRIHPAGEAGTLQMDLRIVSYLALEESP